MPFFFSAICLETVRVNQRAVPCCNISGNDHQWGIINCTTKRASIVMALANRYGDGRPTIITETLYNFCQFESRKKKRIQSSKRKNNNLKVSFLIPRLEL